MPVIAERLRKAMAFHQAGDLERAAHCYTEILSAEPVQFDALHYLGLLEAQRERYGEALSLLDRALRIDPHSVEALTNRGNVLKALDRHAEALASCDRALALDPDSAMVHYNRGNMLFDVDRFEEALAEFDRVLTLTPDHAPALYNRGCILQHFNRYEEALACYDRVLALIPDNVEALHNRGAALLKLRRYDEALASYDRALTAAPDDAEVFSNRGVALYELKRYQDALANYDRALAIMPDSAEAWSNRANVLLDLKQPAEALASWDRALAIKPDFTEALNNRGAALHELHRPADAIASYARALELDPEYEYLYGTWLNERMQICDWSDVENHFAQLAGKILSNKKASAPFFTLALSDSPSLQKKAAEIWVQDKCPANPALGESSAHLKHDKIRIAYCSGDFRDHPSSTLLAGLFEQHDRSRFDAIAVSFGDDDRSEIRTRLKGAFGQFIDVRTKSDLEVARLMRELEVDIAVDLTGHTQYNRMAIFAMRPAPVQVNFFCPGTSGADYLDYIISDRIVIPEEHHVYYSEKVVYLPDSFQVNDSKRRIAEYTPTRAEAGLPDEGFVFCSFNNTYKLTPQMFDIWMRLLGSVEASVLWLQEINATAKQNLRLEAARRGIDAGRLIFAPRVERLEDHLARYRLADLFLDTLPYTAQTTASDALWAGLPVLTCLGSTFVGRVAASLMNAIGLPELITHNLDEYEALALKLARERPLLETIKGKLAQHRDIYPLFDTDRFRRHIEAAYVTMWERHQRGEPPETFAISAAV